MKLRKVLLATMLWSLGLAAVAGVCAAIFGPGETLRFVGTALLTAVGAALMLAAGRLVDRERTRTAGLVGMAAITLEYLLGLLLIWESQLPFPATESAGFTMLAILQVLPPVMLFLSLQGGRENFGARWIGLVACVSGFVLLMIGIWVSSAVLDNWWLSSAAVEGFGIAAALSVVNIGPRRWTWRWLGIASAAVSTVLAFVGIWTAVKGSWVFPAIAGISVVVAHANLAFLCPLRPGQKWVRIITIFAMIAVALLIDVMVHHGEAEVDGLERALTAAGIVAGCGSLALVVLARINRRFVSGASLATDEAQSKLLKHVSLECPHCGSKQNLPIGDSACNHCRLGFQIRVIEPRCPGCGYLLYMLKSDRCPECGIELKKSPPSFPVPA